MSEVVNYERDEIDEKLESKEEIKDEVEEVKEEKDEINPNELLRKYLLIYSQSKDNKDELELRFGTNWKRPVTKIKFNNVIKKLKSLGFEQESIQHYLNINNEFIDTKTGRKKTSNIRTQILNTHNIKKYCHTNTINLEDLNNNFNISFLQKFRKKFGDDVLEPIDFKDFEFRVNYKSERPLIYQNNLVQNLVNNWNDSKKIFRLIKRLTFKHIDFPFKFDLSIIRSSKKYKSRFISEYNIEASNVFKNPETYEIEIEIDNKFRGNYDELYLKLKKSIKIILSALQNTNYPVSYNEQKIVLQEYVNTINGGVVDRKIYSSDFIGPSSISVEMINVIPNSEDLSYPNINLPYTVTEKADGERNLLYISSIGKVYLINVNLEVMFTGCITKNEECFNVIIDGELVERDKENNFINYYLCFDIYYLKAKSVLQFPFINMEGMEYVDKKMSREIFRYDTLLKCLNSLNLECVTKKKAPLKVKPKVFYRNTSKSIFSQCNEILNKVDSDGFIYETDGLIFTPINMGVGSDVIGEKPITSKITWQRSLKWKPPEFNTIDFLVTTKKDKMGVDLISNELIEGINVSSNSNILKYKTLELRVGFDERHPKHGFMNPFQNIIDDDLPKMVQRGENLYRPVRFQPTEPTPNYAAYICKIYLSDDNKMFTEEGDEFFEDETIVEFRFEKTEKKFWQWKPIRVRNDKTSAYRRGEKNYGNAYHVANSVWKSIHNPVTVDMIRTGRGIPTNLDNDDVYYNRSGNKTITRSLRDFHNLVVKKSLILGVSRRGNTLMDQSVGKAGDFNKWKEARLSFVFGIDYSKDNIENRLDGACARYLKQNMKWRSLPKVLYLHGDASKNIRDGTAFFDQKSKQIGKAVFGAGTRDVKLLGKGVHRQYGKGLNGFDVVSNQFSIHYFFENNVKLNNFLRNVSECCKVGGYFIGTCYDGKKVFNKLKNKEVDESIVIMQEAKKMWEIQKNYSQEEFEDDDTCLGYKISVYQESINKVFAEYLVNFDYLTRLIENYGFTPLTIDEAKELGFISGIGSFSLLFNKMNIDIKKNSYLKKKYGTADKLNVNEKKISFLNNYFIFKKRRPVNAESVYNSIVKIKTVKVKLKWKKLKKKIILKK